MIFDDVLSALEAGRSPLVLTARKDRAVRFADRNERARFEVAVEQAPPAERETPAPATASSSRKT